MAGVVAFLPAALVMGLFWLLPETRRARAGGSVAGGLTGSPAGVTVSAQGSPGSDGPGRGGDLAGLRAECAVLPRAADIGADLADLDQVTVRVADIGTDLGARGPWAQ